MEELYRVGGCLNEGFVGQISYTVNLEKEYHSLDIHFTFDKQRHKQVTEELKEKIRTICREKYGITQYPEEELEKLILNEVKAEIHTIATLNGEFIGGVHRQLADRHMLYTPGFATDGCLPQETFSGVLRVTVVVFNVIADDTRYQLSVSAQ